MAVFYLETDESLMELREHGTEAFPYEYFDEEIQRDDGGYIPSHWHRHFEFVTLVDGDMDCVIGTSTIRMCEGDGIFVNSGILHAFRSEGMANLPNILFSPEFIAQADSLIYEKFVKPFLDTGISHIKLERRIPWQAHVLSLLDDIYAHSGKNGETMEIDIHANVCLAWSELYQHRDDMARIERVGLSPLIQGRLRGMITYISEHCSHRILLEDIARSVNVSKSGALRCFKMAAGTTPWAYLIQYRLNKAKSLLLYTTKSVSEIALEVGFESVSYFDHTFRDAFKTTPQAYRKRFGGNHASM